MSMVRAHVIIHGMVQGVFFRAHTRDEAKTYNLTGWVKNRRVGGVEAIFEGRKEDVRKVVGTCHGAKSCGVLRGERQRRPAFDNYRVV